MDTDAPFLAARTGLEELVLFECPRRLPISPSKVKSQHRPKRSWARGCLLAKRSGRRTFAHFFSSYRTASGREGWQGTALDRATRWKHGTNLHRSPYCSDWLQGGCSLLVISG